MVYPVQPNNFLNDILNVPMMIKQCAQWLLWLVGNFRVGPHNAIGIYFKCETKSMTLRC